MVAILEALKQAWHPAALLGRPASLWRYHELLPVRDGLHRPSAAEGVSHPAPIAPPHLLLAGCATL